MNNFSASLPASIQASCHSVLATSPPILSASESQLNSTQISAHGILFTIANPYTADSLGPDANSTNNDMAISSLGFYIDTDKAISHLQELPANSSQTISYEVYTLNGYYADPTRRGAELGTNAFNGGGLPVDYDYRGNFSYWSLVADGVFGIDDLVGVDELYNVSYYMIPEYSFDLVTIQSEHESDGADEASGDTTRHVQSFYLTLKGVGALYQASLENWQSLNDPQQLLHCGKQLTITGILGHDTKAGCSKVNQQDDLPILQIGEGVASYPFYTTPYFYTPRKFIGRIYVVSSDCPTTAPSITPTEIPTSNNTSPPSISPTPTVSNMASADAYIDAIPNGCHRYISTDENYSNFTNETSASYGIIFPMQTNEEDNDGVWISSLGFYVDFQQMVPSIDSEDGTINYEVYTLKEGGYYADPNRIRSSGTPEEYDYRGNFTYWKIVASGTISKSFLSFYNFNKKQDNDVETYFYQIPWDRFEPTFVPSNGGVQSFYLTLNSGSLVYSELIQKQSIGKIQKDDNYQRNYEGSSHPPLLLIGEGVIGYPFNTVPFLYTAKQFVGKVYYEIECPSESPSASPSEHPSVSLAPSSIPSAIPSTLPTYTPSPTGQPSISMMPHSENDSSASKMQLFTYWFTIALMFSVGF